VGLKDRGTGKTHRPTFYNPPKRRIPGNRLSRVCRHYLVQIF